ncbi:MAG: hypothetical protein EA427_12925 [Spirochaetaceae bacterium]|nr:MAG: hypothetical protein EA427_12925 [Spirochaetaceae bacterium]
MDNETKSTGTWVLGAGFAGIQAAKAILRRSRETTLVLVDRNTCSTMIPALPDVLSGRVLRSAISRPVPEVFPASLRSRLDFRRGTVTAVDLDARTLIMDGVVHAWDTLVIATGSVPEYYGFTPDAPMHSVHSLEHAEALRRDFEARAPGLGAQAVPVIIVGAGYTGLEVAASLRRGAGAAGFPQPEITVVEQAEEILPFLPERQRRHIRAYLQSLDVRIRTGTSLTSFDGHRARLSDGTEVEGALVCWAAGMSSSAIAVSGRVDHTRDGRIRTDETLQVPGYPRVFVAGDAAAIEKGGVLQRRAVNFAYYSGRRAGRNAAGVIRENASRGPSPPRKFFPLDLGWIIPLGGTSVGLVFGIFRVRGTLGLRMHYAMCGFRHFGVREALEFFKTALHLGRTPDPPR